MEGGIGREVGSKQIFELLEEEDPQRNVMGQCTEMSPLVSMLFWTFLIPLKFLMESFNMLVYIHKQLSDGQREEF